MNACSLVIRARRDRRADVRAALDCTRGVAVEGETGAAQIVVIADYDDAGAAAQAYVALSRIDGVLSARSSIRCAKEIRRTASSRRAPRRSRKFSPIASP